MKTTRKMIFHNLQSLISVGAEVTNEGDVFVAISACKRNSKVQDQPRRSVANNIITERLTRGKLHRAFMGTYDGEDVGKDVFGPIRDTVRKLRPRRNASGVHEQILLQLRKSTTQWLDKTVPSGST